MSRAFEVSKALRGRRSGEGWICHCPAHDDSRPSLSVRDGEDGILLFFCHAGCSAANVASALGGLGYSQSRFNGVRSETRRDESDWKKEQIRSEQRRILASKKLWLKTLPPKNSPVEVYLRKRGFDGNIPPTIRYCPNADHTTSRQQFPAMIAAKAIWPNREVTAVHRTYLAKDGSSKAPVADPKKMLGLVKGGAVRFGPVKRKIVVCEGIETGLSVLTATGDPVWAALSTGGITSLVLPDFVKSVTIAADNDEPGIKAAQLAAEKWKLEGRAVHIAVPPIYGADFNDLAMEGVK